MKIAYLSFGESPHDVRFLSKMVEWGHNPFLISYYGKNLVSIEGVHILKFDYQNLYKTSQFVSSLCQYQFAKKILAFQIGQHLKKLLKKLNVDILHTNFIQYEGFCGALSGFHPVVSVPWGSDILINPRLSKLDRLITKYTLKKADKIVCDCEIMKNTILKLTGLSKDAVDVFPFGINLKVFYPSQEARRTTREKLNWQDKKILLMNRNFKEVYGIEYFIKALPYIIKKFPDTKVILLGGGPDKDKYVRMIMELKLSDVVFLPGFVNEKEMARYLNAADVYISIPSSDGTSVSLLEAMACRLPVVVSDLLANREWVEDGVNGFIVPIQNSRALTNAISNLFADEKTRKDFADKNLRIARERADWDKNYEKLDIIYRKLVRS